MENGDDGHRDGLSRRAFIAGLIGAGLIPGCAVAASAEPAGFPDGLALYPDRYENWAGEFSFADLPTCAPRTPEDVLALVRWAARAGYAVRPRGAMHNWSPLCTGESPPRRLVLVDMLPHLDRMEITTADGLPAVRVQAGARMDDLLAFIESQGFGFSAVPAIGEISVGGALAIGGHGAAVPARGEPRAPGQTFGSLANRVLALTAVAWNARQQRYMLRTFHRADPEMDGLLVHLGRAFVTEVVLALEANRNLRCVSHVDIPASELFASPGSGGRDIASFLDSAGRIEAIWYPFTERPWLKVWSVSPTKPLGSRTVRKPYNYPFSDNFPDSVMQLAKELVTGHPAAAPLFGRALYAATVAGLAATNSKDLWGASKNTMVFIKASTLQVHESSYVVVTRRDHAQQVISEFAARYEEQLMRHAAEGRFPVNMPVEIRVTGLDHASDMGIPGARTATLSALAPRPDRPDWDTGVWLSMLTIPGTPGMYGFFREMEQWLLQRFSGDDACARPEWSKGWAYTDDGAWRDPDILRGTIPDAFRSGRSTLANWDTAVARLDALDAGRLYRNSFLAKLVR